MVWMNEGIETLSDSRWQGKIHHKWALLQHPDSTQIQLALQVPWRMSSDLQMVAEIYTQGLRQLPLKFSQQPINSHLLQAHWVRSWYYLQPSRCPIPEIYNKNIQFSNMFKGVWHSSTRSQIFCQIYFCERKPTWHDIMMTTWVFNVFSKSFCWFN